MHLCTQVNWGNFASFNPPPLPEKERKLTQSGFILTRDAKYRPQYKPNDITRHEQGLGRLGGRGREGGGMEGGMWR